LDFIVALAGLDGRILDLDSKRLVATVFGIGEPGTLTLGFKSCLAGLDDRKRSLDFIARLAIIIWMILSMECYAGAAPGTTSRAPCRLCDVGASSLGGGHRPVFRKCAAQVWLAARF
jgi:hypothetical protein